MNKFIKYTTIAAGLLLMSVGLQSCKDDEIHEVFTGIDYTFTFQSGEIINPADIIKEKDFATRLFSKNDDVVDYEWDEKLIYAMYGGSTVLYNDECVIGVTVLPYTGPELFPQLPDLSMNWNVATIKQEMKDYTLASEGPATVDGRKCIALKYAPFGNSDSITFYVIDSGWAYFYCAIIDTGKSVADNRGFLLRDYELDNNSGHIGQQNFVKKSSYSYRGTIINTTDDWKTLYVTYR